MFDISVFYITVYTRSWLREQTTPFYLLISDGFATVSDVTFPDRDLDPQELGGVLTWIPPQDPAQVAAYHVYFFDGINRTALGDGYQVPIGTNQLDILVDTPMGENHQILVYTKSLLVEQSTPSMLFINDTDSSISNLSFIDRDLDGKELGGKIMWKMPEDVQYVTEYLVYLSADDVGTNRSQIGPAVQVSMWRNQTYDCIEGERARLLTEVDYNASDDHQHHDDHHHDDTAPFNLTNHTNAI
jgi:hypothetical protein